MRTNTTAFPTASNDTTLSLGSIGHDTELAPTVSVCVLLLGLNIAFPSSGPSPGHHQRCRAASAYPPTLLRPSRSCARHREPRPWQRAHQHVRLAGCE